MTYKENSNEYIKNYGLSIGDTVKVNKDNISYTGILLDRPEDAEDGYLFITGDPSSELELHVVSDGKSIKYSTRV